MPSFEMQQTAFPQTTPIAPPTFSPATQLRYGEGVFVLGSCFSVAMQRQLSALGFRAFAPLFGPLYNPLSIADTLQRLANESFLFGEQDLLYYEGDHYLLAFDTRWVGLDKEELLHSANKALLTAREQLRSAKHLLLTFGSTHVYRCKATGEIAANCQKLPGSLFTEECCSIEQMLTAIVKTLEKVRSWRGGVPLNIITSVSPVRYLKYGLPENSRIKARLLLMTEQLTLLQREVQGITYFPAYEILLDELRDYRYYAEDMTHPSHLSECIIFERLMSTWLAEEEQRPLAAARKLSQLAAHRVLHPTKKSLHQQAVHRMARQLAEQYPAIEISTILSASSI